MAAIKSKKENYNKFKLQSFDIEPVPLEQFRYNLKTQMTTSVTIISRSIIYCKKKDTVSVIGMFSSASQFACI